MSSKNLVKPHCCNKCCTGHHLLPHRSSFGCIKVITNKLDIFNPTYYKSHIINQIQSLQTHELTATVWVQKIEYNHIVATNAAQVITYFHTGHHAQNVTDLIYLFKKLVLGFPKRMI